MLYVLDHLVKMLFLSITLKTRFGTIGYLSRAKKKSAMFGVYFGVILVLPDH